LTAGTRSALALLALASCLVPASPAESSRPAQHLRLDVLVVVYTRTFTATTSADELRELYGRVDEAVESYWTGSGGRLRLAVDTLTVERLVREDQFAWYEPEHFWLGRGSGDGVNGVENDLLERGIALDRYDVVAVFYAWRNGPGHLSRFGGAALPVNTMLGKAAYLAIPLAWNSAHVRSIFEHEMLHALSSIFEKSGFSRFAEVHNQDFFESVYGEDASWLHWILRSVPDESYLGIESWGTIEDSSEGRSDGAR